MQNRLNYLQAMEIQSWVLKTIPTTNPSSEWQTLQSAVINCTACPLHQSRTQTVFGVGNQNADLMIIGEAPGFYEDQKRRTLCWTCRAIAECNATVHWIGSKHGLHCQYFKMQTAK